MSLLALLHQAAGGSFPADHGAIEVLPPPSGPCDAVVALTGHSIVAAGVSESWVEERVPNDDLTGPMRADFVADLAKELGAKPGYADREGEGCVNLGRGLDGRLDLSIELPAETRSAGRGRGLIEAARTLARPEEFLFASVAPGNARCLRATLAAGFAPIGGEILFLVRPASLERAV